MTYTEAEVDALRGVIGPAATQSIFNPNRGKRLQHPLGITTLEGSLRTKLHWLDHFLKVAYQECEPTDWVCLWSERGCLEQQPHADYSRAAIDEAVAHDPRAYPFACKQAAFVCFRLALIVTVVLLRTGIANLREPAHLKLHVVVERDGEHVLEELTDLTLNPGDVLVMRGDLVHAGGGYEHGHFARLHCYLDNPRVKRGANTTDRKLPPTKGGEVKRAVASKHRRYN